LHEQDLLNLHNILDSCVFSERTWFWILRLWHETGNIVNHQPTICGCLHALDHEDIDCLLCLIRQNPDYFWDELMHLLATNQFISVHFTTIFRKLECANMSYKKLKRIAKEHNKTLHAEFITHMAQYDPQELGFIDKTSKDERTPGRPYGRSQTGTRAQKKQVFVHGRWTPVKTHCSENG
ncbi:hypothetical protein EV424DRAFT_1330924, partial [Suillus variegatus]